LQEQQALKARAEKGGRGRENGKQTSSKTKGPIGKPTVVVGICKTPRNLPLEHDEMGKSAN